MNFYFSFGIFLFFVCFILIPTFSTGSSSSKKNDSKKQEKEKIEVVAIDCEMVGINSDGKGNMLARVSIVNSEGVTIYDNFVKPTKEITNYRTAVSGVRPQDIENGELFSKVKNDVSEILKGKLLVGHALVNDFRVLKISHPKRMIRDTSTYWEFKQLTDGRIPSLKRLTSHFLGVNIQEGEHSSVQDAKATLQLYMLVRENWESMLKNRKSRPRKGNKSIGSKHKQSNN
ncbi:RNA exonuclease 4-like [Daktulosphaira vitifoliae]|uniref:RNA exonuclease 4-like n=1 Tax=Daktulosphaira vitifoliae TaxID=58002 RepID=UPI0021AADA14|nr:RNA exonuclease 4-like [Daktulosphaira vitifoliae]